MTPDEQRIAIAESLGWKRKWQWQGGGVLFDEHPSRPCWPVWIPPKDFYQTNAGRRVLSDPDSTAAPPNYPESLDACSEFESAIVRDGLLWNVYEKTLQRICDKAENITPTISATAAQRCEAYLRTKGLWK